MILILLPPNAGDIHSMKGRRWYDPDISDENDPTKQGIKGREKFPETVLISITGASMIFFKTL